MRRLRPTDRRGGVGWAIDESGHARPVAVGACRALGRYDTLRFADGLAVDGYRFYFFSREGQEPPHIHVEQAERYAKFWLSPVSLAATRGFSSHELGRLSQLVLEHRAFFEEQWYGHLRNQG